MEEEKTLYHYTSIEGLNSILNNRSVWASDCRFLNDTNELKVAFDSFLGNYSGIEFEALRMGLHSFGYTHYHCVLSLSKSPKILSQWRAYGDDGKGACIGFKPKYIHRMHKEINKNIVDCVYSDHDDFIKSLTSKYQQEIDEVVLIYKKEPAINLFFSKIEKRPDLLDGLISELLRVKNISFVEECETRVVMHVPKDIMKTRVSNGLIIPYFEHKLLEDEDASFMFCIVPEIWLGPKSDRRNEEALRAYSSYGMINIKFYDCGYV
ncbi:MAG: hypothetical protein CL624_00900 [Arcobacter sp.]|nr:hypothetical protein [Arcobacter sp.]|tara:strand:- start:7880 stop:8674 length:795 start_codon:yes stop_codon:yes gene_type:complete